MQYYFTGVEHPIVKPSHGNSERKSPYKHTNPKYYEAHEGLMQKMGPVENCSFFV